MIEYKPKTTNIIINMILVVLLILAVLTLKRDYSNLSYLISIILLIYFISVIFFKKRLVSFKIYTRENKIGLTFKNYLVVREENTYQIEGLKYSFDYEPGSRGTKRKEFKIYTITDELILSIVPNSYGWSMDKIQQIIESLEKIGVN